MMPSSDRIIEAAIDNAGSVVDISNEKLAVIVDKLAETYTNWADLTCKKRTGQTATNQICKMAKTIRLQLSKGSSSIYQTLCVFTHALMRCLDFP
ncbi:hypothetical protein AYI68_g2412 [Smittium mucronatum]|uniref:Uncharacterized protein n=1 Tax=Smittium mucronatum TaxID=133383 RepID=A0A1R0H2Q9_9FUNG|nr:hypothetical protein AYI68_g2412 [Smittium mucronatum]